MAAPGTFTDFVQRYQTVQAYEHTRDKLLQDLLLYCQGVEENLQQENQKLKIRLHEAELDLNAATKSRRDLQHSLQEAEAHIKWVTNQNDNLKNENPYILILIDGDGLIFQEHLIKQGLEGGKKAAYALRAAVAELCTQERTNSLEIICRVVANVSGLGKALCRDGSLDDPSLFKEFTLGFTQAKASFDFLDVGYGKERADSKIRGYAPFLDEVLEDETSKKCVSLIKSIPLVRELESLKMNVIEFDSIFRTTKLTDKSPIEKQTVQKPDVGTHQPSPTVILPTQAVLTPATSNASMSPPAASWAKVTKSATPPPQLTMPLPPKQNSTSARNKTPPQPAWSPGARGLDPSVTVGLQAMESIKRRAGNDKLCNNHFLRGPCTRIDSCPFVHNYKPTQEELRALAMLSRQNPCTRGQECDVDDCIYGHHCPNVSNLVCTRQYCRFKVDSHPPGTKFTNKNIHDN
ncbi:c-x8-c-x5-c-x3-h zinc finger [Fusarium albosuccineum]|uniref:C-x8-c-x5-c-x3-h zinc finger n=1 Tax=Fusarium albosuccineum TaxID=1237068 RepID=A0A8H4L5P5_9HYPO|nr:c-x8-c-x5-c-x3-h zinc finger [Fusarium albosuccineum]